MAKPYIDRHDFHREIRSCKLNNKLSDKAVEYFMTLSTEISANFYRPDHNDTEDLISSANLDLVRYWRGFKENNIAKIEVIRELVPGDYFHVKIKGLGEWKFVAEGKKKSEAFPICNTINESLRALRDKVNDICTHTTKIEVERRSLEAFNNTVKRSVTFMDTFNYKNLGVKSEVVLHSADPENHFAKIADKPTYHMEFKEPGNAFSYFTSICMNGMYKALRVIDPKDQKASNTIRLDNAPGGSKVFNL